MIVTTKELFEHAYGKYAIGAYNINNLEQCMGLFRGNVDSKAPFIVQISRGARDYTDKRMLEGIIRAADAVFPEAIFAVHLDHGTEEACMDCIASGFYSSVMIDASHEPFEKNVEITKRVVEAAHAKGLVVEAELGQLGGVEEDVIVDEANANLTNPEEAERFVKETGCDSLACAIGTSHGAYKFTGSQGSPLRGHRGHPAPSAQVPHGHARLEFRARRRGGANQRRRRQAPRRKGRGRESVRQGGDPRRDQGEHRHRRSARVDPRPPRVLP